MKDYPKDIKVKRLIRLALQEDIGEGDITTDHFIPKSKRARAVLIAKEDCVICGLGIAMGVFKEMDKKIKFELFARDGQQVKKGKVIARLNGRAQPILTAERVALNFLGLLSGVATQTKAYIDKVKPYRVKIADTRKTIPCLRYLEKYAVQRAGGSNHRFRLDEMVMVKENHIRVIGYGLWAMGLKQRVQEVRKKYLSSKIEIEVENLKEFKGALEANPDIVMLDNMSISDIKKAIKIKNAIRDARCAIPKIEASGGVNLKNVRSIAATGVDMISVGALTHSVDSVDISLEIV